jgi:hypothetical protein
MAQERQDHSNPSFEHAKELEAMSQLTIDNLPTRLGFIESPKLAATRARLVAAFLRWSPEAIGLQEAYIDQAQQLVDQHPHETRPRAQIGLTVSLALLRRDGHRPIEYANDLADASEYAGMMGYDDIVTELAPDLAEAKAHRPILPEIGPEGPTPWQVAQACSHVLSSADVEELVSQNDPDMIGAAYPVLIENGVEDPMSYLMYYGVLEA